MRSGSSILCSALLLCALFRKSSSQGDCGCNVSVWGRRFCEASPFARNRQECEAAGCCYDLDIFSSALQCYERDWSACPPDPGLGNNYDVCVAATPLRQCGFNYNQQFCESVNCCYVSVPPFCVLPATQTNNVVQLTSQWGQWSVCSSACSSGTRIRSRQCLAQNPLECNRRGIDLSETEICNAEMCNLWGTWNPSPCSVTCGTGTFTYTRRCIGFGSLGSPDCYSATAACNRPECPIPTPPINVFPNFGRWSQWSLWSDCSNPCGPGRRSRTRDCVLDGAVVGPEQCPINIADGTTSLQTKDCNPALCSIWSHWSRATSCSETCGSRATRFVTRLCLDSSQAGFVTSTLQSCNSRREDCNLPPCPVVTAQPYQTEQTTSPGNIFTFSPTASPVRTASTTLGAGIFTIVWSSTSTPRTPFQIATEPPTTTTTTMKPATNPRTTTNVNPSTTSSTRSATSTTIATTISGSVGPESTTTPFSPTVNPEGFVTTTPPFWESTVPVIPFNPEETPSPRGADISTLWSPWSTWSMCSKTCGPGSQIRTRICFFSNGTATESESDCGINAVDISKCNDGECAIPTISTTTTESTTVVPDITTDGILETTVEITESPTTDSVKAEWGSWQTWTQCSSTCSPGLRTRTRTCERMGTEVDPTECDRSDPGSMFDEGECNTDLCLRWTVWRSTGCSVTCNRPNEPPGVVLNRRRCLEPEVKRAREACYLVSDICNATTPCPVSSTTAEPTTTTSITTESSTSTTESLITTESPTTSPSGGDTWTEWAEWSACSSSCSPGIQTRARQCLPNVPQQICASGGLMSRACNQGFCTGWSRWRVMPCDRTCGDDGSQLRRRICLSGQSLDSMPDSCSRVSQPCESSVPCVEVKTYPKQDILFLVDSSTHVDDCDSIQKATGLSAPLRTPQLTDQIAPTYARIKKFMTDFVEAWQGISNEGTRVGIQLISGLCNGRTRANLYVEKRYNETHELLKEYIAHMPYLCGDFWLDWAMQCSYSTVMSERYGDRKDVPNLVVAIVSHVPFASLPRESLMQRIIKRLQTKATILSATATNATTLGPVSRQRYIEHTQNIACPGGNKCSHFLGSIWDADSTNAADKIRDVLSKS